MTARGARTEPFSEYDGRVGQAWSLNYRGQYDAAITKFLALLEEWPDHLDANFGLALCYKNAGQKEKASEAFRKAKALVEAELGRATGDTSRFQMLLRMVDQHLATVA